MNVGWAPVVPERPRQQSDRDWIADYQRRSSASRLRGRNLVAAADAASVNAGLGRAWTETRMTGERRQASRSGARRIVSDSRADAAAIERYRETQRGMASLTGRGGSVSRARQLAAYSRENPPPPGMADHRSCPHCRDLGFDAEESRSLHLGSTR